MDRSFERVARGRDRSPHRPERSIDRVDMIIAELHDKSRTGCARAFYNATNGFSSELRKGENIVLHR